MVIKCSVPCNFNGQTTKVDFFIGNPQVDVHPINFQAKWLSDVKGGSVPQNFMDSIQKVRELAEREHVSIEDMCLYTINMANGIEQEDNKIFNKILVKNDKKKKAEETEKIGQ
jgi:hypothetical protein